MDQGLIGFALRGIWGFAAQVCRFGSEVYRIHTQGLYLREELGQGFKVGNPKTLNQKMCQVQDSRLGAVCQTLG